MDVRKMMQVQEVIENNESIKVITTGAVYIIHKSKPNGKIECLQRLNKKRKCAQVSFNIPFDKLTVEVKDKEKCILNSVPYKLSSSYIRIEINMDSMVNFFSTSDTQVVAKTDIEPAYYAVNAGNTMVIDDIGGIGYYPYRGFGGMECTRNDRGVWTHNYSMKRDVQFIFSGFPPRRYNLRQSFEDRMYLRFNYSNYDKLPLHPYPSNEDLKRASEYTNIVWLKEDIWQGKRTRDNKKLNTQQDVIENAAFCNYNYIPADPAEMERTILKAHSLNMKVIPYVSPYYSLAKGDEYISIIKNLIKKYDFDGVYLDGISRDIMDSYITIKKIRNFVQGGIVFRHCTSDPVGKKLF